jgi:hypothetical protein
MTLKFKYEYETESFLSFTLVHLAKIRDGLVSPFNQSSQVYDHWD